MSAYLGVAAPTGPSQNQAGDGPKSSSSKRSGAGKEAAKKSSSMESSGVTGGGGATEGITGVTGITEGETQAAPAVVASEVKHLPTIAEFYGGEPGEDMSKWVRETGPVRIKESRLTEDEKTRFKRHLDLIFSKEIVFDQRANFDMDDVMEVMKKVIPYLESEPVLIEDVPFDISIVGDLHGQLYDLKRVFCGDDKDGKPGWERGKKYLFLGDYVDRGRQALEVVMTLFCLKMLYPDNIFILRGNHEFTIANVDEQNSLCLEIQDRYEPKDAKIIYFQINETFCYLSIGAIVGDSYLCAHAGISPGFTTRQHLRGIYKPIKRSTDYMVVHDMVWSDPGKGVFGSAFNASRGTSCAYGYDAMVIAMACMRVKGVFRGHQPMVEGYAVFWDVLFTVFAATSEKNKGAVAVIDANGRVSMRVFSAHTKRLTLEDDMREERGQERNVTDEKSRYAAK